MLKLLQGIGVGILCAVLVGTVFLLGWFEVIELWTLDRRLNLVPRVEELQTDTLIVAIDQDSIEDVYERQGIRWPWPREFYGKMVDYLASSGARAVIFDIFFSEPDIERDEISAADSDAALVEATAHGGRVYHAVMLQDAGLKPPPDEVAALMDRIRAIDLTLSPGCTPHSFGTGALPSPELTESSRMVGFVNVLRERDNVFRRIPMLALLEDVPLPSLSLAAAWDLQGRPRINAEPRALHLGNTRVPVDAAGRAYLWWRRPPQDEMSIFPYLPAVGVLHSAIQSEMGHPPQIPPETFKDKIVFFASTAPGLHDIRSTPLAKLTPGVEIHATALSNLLRGEFISRLPKSLVLSLLTVLCIALGASSRGIRHAGPGTITAIVIVGIVALAGYWLLAARRIFLDIVPLSAGALATFLTATYVNYLDERKHSTLVRNIFEHYLDRSVVKTLISNPERVRLGGERRHCTVIFSDVANFTSTSEQMAAEQVVQFMNLYLDAMTDIIIEEGGFVDKFVGDEIVAIFGAPNELPDHPIRACRAVVRMRAKISQLQTQFQQLGCPAEVFARTGICTGDLIVGNMGSEDRMNYTAMGDMMNLCSRLESANKSYGTRILVNGATAETATEFFFREIDLVRVKGKEQAVRIYSLMDETSAITSASRADAGTFADALKLYREGDWQAAATIFEQLSAAGDAPAGVLLARCRGLAANPPESWDGVFVMEVK